MEQMYIGLAIMFACLGIGGMIYLVVKALNELNKL